MNYAQIILTLILGVYAVHSSIKWSSLRTTQKFLTVLSYISCVVIAINSYQDIKQKDLIEKINSSFGELVSTDKATLPVIEIGHGKAKFIVGKYGLFSYTPFGNLIKVFVENKRLMCNAVLRNKKGEPILALYNNEWTLYDKNYEYNNDDYGLELVNKGDRDVFFHIDLKEGIAHMEGILINQEKFGVLFEGENKGASFMKIFPNDEFLPKLKAKRIFKYPRDKHMGERETEY